MWAIPYVTLLVRHEKIFSHDAFEFLPKKEALLMACEVKGLLPWDSVRRYFCDFAFKNVKVWVVRQLLIYVFLVNVAKLN